MVGFLTEPTEHTETGVDMMAEKQEGISGVFSSSR